MRIEVIIDIDKNNREVYGFNLFDLTAVFVSYSKQIKPKRTWLVEKGWDKYARDNGMPEPVLPDLIKELAFKKMEQFIKVLTWAEWKN
ncbi:MAG: hypothetical protein WCN92_02880 [Eubacteriales bacterium]